jgi:hypothetical protein
LIVTKLLRFSENLLDNEKEISIISHTPEQEDHSGMFGVVQWMIENRGLSVQSAET